MTKDKATMADQQGSGEYQADLWQIVTDAKGFEHIHETDEDGRPGDLVADVYGDNAELIVRVMNAARSQPTVLDEGNEFSTVEAWEHDDQRELSLLYNHRADDSLQFTRGQMRTAIRHGRALASQSAVREALERIADVSERWRDSLVSQINEIARTALAQDCHEGGWIVTSNDGKRYRTWEHGSPAWTDSREEATRYHRRQDAEAVHAEDEDAWRVVPFAAAIRTHDASEGGAG